MRPRSSFIPLATAVLVTLGLARCNGDESGAPAGPLPSIQLTAAPGALTIAQGSTGSALVTLVRGGGFIGDVTLTVEGLPTGVTATSVPPTLSGATVSATVTFAVAASAATSVTTATIRATGSGVTAATATVTITVVSAPNFTLALNPTALTQQPGTTAAVMVTITRTNFTAAVAVTVESPTPGITGASNPTSVADGNAVVTINVGEAVPVGTYTLTIKGTAAPVGERTATLAVTVATPPPAPSYTLSVAPTSLTIPQGANGVATVSIARTNFTGAVTLSLDAPPAGISGSFAPGTTTGTTSVLTLSVALSVPAGNHTLTIRGTDGGLLVRSVTMTLSVTAASGNSVEFQFCSSSENPLFFAFQDGAGAWTTVQATLSGGVYRYSFSLALGSGGVFFVQTSGGTSSIARSVHARQPRDRIVPDALAVLRPGLRSSSAIAAVATYETTVFYGTTSELVTAGLDNCADTQSTRTVWLQVLGVGNGQQATLSLGGVTTTFEGLVDQSPVEFPGVRNGVIDFFGSREAIQTGVPGRLMDVRNLNPPDGSTLPFTADFNSAAAYDPAQAQLTVANALGDNLFNFASFHTTNGAVGDLSGGNAPSTATTRTWYGVPAAKLQNGDVHSNSVFALPVSSSTNEARFLLSYVTAVQDALVTLGTRLPTPTVTSVGTPSYRRIRVQGVLPSEYSGVVGVDMSPSGGGNEFMIAVTGGYLLATGGQASYDVQIPDLTALTGFPIVSGLSAGEIETLIGASGWSGTGLLEPTPVAGTLVRGALKQVSIVVP